MSHPLPKVVSVERVQMSQREQNEVLAMVFRFTGTEDPFLMAQEAEAMIRKSESEDRERHELLDRLAELDRRACA